MSAELVGILLVVGLILFCLGFICGILVSVIEDKD